MYHWCPIEASWNCFFRFRTMWRGLYEAYDKNEVFGSKFPYNPQLCEVASEASYENNKGFSPRHIVRNRNRERSEAISRTTLGLYEVLRLKGAKFGWGASRAPNRIALVIRPERNAVKRERSVARSVAEWVWKNKPIIILILAILYFEHFFEFLVTLFKVNWSSLQGILHNRKRNSFEIQLRTLQHLLIFLSRVQLKNFFCEFSPILK